MSIERAFCWVTGHAWRYGERADCSQYRVCPYCDKFENLYKKGGYEKQH